MIKFGKPSKYNTLVAKLIYASLLLFFLFVVVNWPSISESYNYGLIANEYLKNQYGCESEIAGANSFEGFEGNCISGIRRCGIDYAKNGGYVVRCDGYDRADRIVLFYVWVDKNLAVKKHFVSLNRKDPEFDKLAGQK